jgi:hypothetical protein
MSITVFMTARAEESSRPDFHHSNTNPNSEDPVVKKSLSNVCYPKSHIGYRQTSKFTPYNSMSECRDSGGRPPKASKKN